MSVQALGWVFSHSPLRGTALALHLAVADSVNDQHGNELWMSQANLARKARTTRPTVNRVLAEMVDLGLLELLEEGRGGTNRYRFLTPDRPVEYQPGGVSKSNTPPVSKGDTPVSKDDRGVCREATGGVSKSNTIPIEPKGNPSSPRRASFAAEIHGRAS